MDEILKIVYERTKERKLINPDDVIKICNIIIQKNNYSFVKNVEFFKSNSIDKNCAGVYYDDHIFFFKEGIFDMIQNHSDTFTAVYQNEGALIDVYNYYLLNIIFHELAHVRQHYITMSNKSCIEKKIFSLFLELSTNRDFYKENYSDILTEVNANNVASTTVNSIYSKLPKNFVTKTDRNIYQSEMLSTILYSNYDVVIKEEMVISPAEKILLNITDDVLNGVHMTSDQYQNLIYNYDKLTLYKRLMLGLPITYQEYAYVNLLNGELKGDNELGVIKKLQKVKKL